MKHLKHHITFLFSLLLGVACFSPLSAQFYNGTKVSFGKNRVQYDAFDWQFYRFNKFETYFYTGGKDLAVHTAKYAHKRIGELEKFLDFYLDERIQFIVYNKQSHYRQSNIGLSTEDNYNIGGVTKIVGSKVFIYFEGDYEAFEKQIDAGLLEVLIYQMIYGGNWREVLRNSTLLSLPEWYVKGLVSYFSNDEDPLINARIKDGLERERFDKFNALNDKDKILAGHAIWQYVADTYGENVISNILYMTRISREVDDGFLYVIGVTFKELYEQWLADSQGIQSNPNSREYADLGETVKIKSRKDRRYQNFSSDPSGRYITYTTNKLGQYKVYLLDTETNKRKKIFKDEHKLERIQDYSYPLLRWHPSGKLFTFITEDKGDVLLHTYNVEEDVLAQKPIFKIEKILSYSYLKDGKQFVFSGVNEGQSDIYIYNVLGNTQRKITDDVYDDLEPVIDGKGERIFFVSNRPNDSLNVPHEVDRFQHEKDVFVLNLNDEDTPISSVTDTDDKDESSPILVDDKLHYLIHNKVNTIQFDAKYDSAVSKIDTIVHYRYFFDANQKAKYDLPVLSQSTNEGNKIYQTSIEEGRYVFYKKDLSIKPGDTNEEGAANQISNNQITQEESFEIYQPPTVIKEVDIDNYEFNNSKKKQGGAVESTPVSKTEEQELVFPTQRLYRLNFRTDNSVLQLNNTFINSQYQLFNGGPYINSGVGINTKIGIVDLMEDHRIYGGFRYAGELIEYSLSYQNLKKRLDKEYMISRTKERVSDRLFIRNGNVLAFAPHDIRTLRGVASFSYPFSEVTSLRAVASVRNDKVISLSTSRTALETEIFNEYWGSLKSAYVYDNTREIATNIRYGTRFNIFFEHYRLAYSENEESPSSELSVFGFDFRNYQKLHRELIFVSRVAGSRSFGKTPLVYYLGGVDEWWSQDVFDRSTPIDPSQNYGFQALAANLRGFRQNVRNGNNFVVLNTELRLPVFSYFINRPIQSELVRNFQIVGFGDIGTAWVGDSPYADDNPLNNETKREGPITVIYEDINDPLVGGIGFGLRSTVLGYFVRTDWAWGIENGEISKESQFMFSLTLDI